MNLNATQRISTTKETKGRERMGFWTSDLFRGVRSQKRTRHDALKSTGLLPGCALSGRREGAHFCAPFAGMRRPCGQECPPSPGLFHLAVFVGVRHLCRPTECQKLPEGRTPTGISLHPKADERALPPSRRCRRQHALAREVGSGGSGEQLSADSAFDLCPSASHKIHGVGLGLGVVEIKQGFFDVPSAGGGVFSYEAVQHFGE